MVTFLGGTKSECLPGKWTSKTVSSMATYPTNYNIGRFWLGSMASLDVTSKFCSFKINGNTCIVRGGNGLPVELLQFGVE